MNRMLAMLLCITWGTTINSAQADDWKQWRGPNRTDRSAETGLLQSWPEGGPKKLWVNRESGLGYAGFSIADGKLFTLGEEDGSQFALCLDANKGDEIWRKDLGSGYKNGWGDGPRNTPTIDGDHVYFLSASGDLACLKAADGEIVWEKSLIDFGGRIPRWGYSESVLVDGDLVVCTPGGKQGAVLALNKMSGETVWQSKDFTDGAQYSSIVIASNGDEKQYVQLTMKSLVGISPKDGSVLWKQKWPGAIAVIPTPICKDGRVYVSSGYGVGSMQIELDSDNNVAERWFNKVMKNHHGGVILVDGHLFGYSDRAGWVCQNWETGERVWNERRALGKGAIAYADGRFYCLDERSGEIALIEASTEGWKEHGRFKIDPQTKRRKPSGMIWVHPVISNGKLYLRDQEIIVCYDIKAE